MVALNWDTTVGCTTSFFNDVIGCSVSGTTLTKTAATAAWDSGASSIQAIEGNGGVSWVVTASPTANVVGLSPIDSSAGYVTIGWALCYADTILKVWEYGVDKGTVGTSPVAGDVLSIRRVGSTVTYYKNDVLLYTSLATTTARLYFDSTIYTIGAKVSNVTLTGAVSTPKTSSIVKTGTSAAWDAKASAQPILSDGTLEWVINETSAHRMLGFAKTTGGLSYTDIDYCVNVNAGFFRVYELGTVFLGAGNTVPVVTGDTIRISKVGPTVEYRLNGQVVYTSLVLSPTEANISFFENIVGCSLVGDVLTKTATTGAWDSGASSSRVIVGDGEISGRLATGFIFGASSSIGISYALTTVKFGMAFSTATDITVYESGVSLGVKISGVIAGGVATIRKVGTTISYLYNGAVIYTSTVAASAPIYFNCAFFVVASYTSGVTMTGATLPPGRVPSLVPKAAIYTPGGVISGITLIDQAVTRNRVLALNPAFFVTPDYGIITDATNRSSAVLSQAAAGGSWAQATAANQPMHAAFFDNNIGCEIGPFFENIVNCTVAGRTVTKTAGAAAWDASVQSSQRMAGDCYVEAKAGTAGVSTGMLALSAPHRSVSFASSNYLFYTTAASTLIVYEFGVNKAAIGAFVTGDLLRVQRVGSTVTFWQNGVLKYTSLTPSTGPLMAHIPFLAVNSFFSDVVLSGAGPVPGNSLIKTAATTAWDSGASSAQTILGNGYVEFTIPQTDFLGIVGLSTSDTNQSYATIGWGLLFSNAVVSEYEVMELGVVKTGAPIVYAAGDKFRVQRTGSTITYYQNGVLVYTSLATTTAPLMFDSSIYHYTLGRGTINNIAISGGTTISPFLKFVKARPDFLVGPVIPLGTAPYTIAGVWKLTEYPAAATYSSVIWDGIQGTDGVGYHPYSVSPTDSYLNHVAAVGAVQRTCTNNAEIHIARHNGTQALGRNAGTDLTPSALVAQLAPTTRSVIGAWNTVGNAGISMNLQALAVFTRSLSTTEMDEFRAAMSDLYGVETHGKIEIRDGGGVTPRLTVSSNHDTLVSGSTVNSFSSNVCICPKPADTFIAGALALSPIALLTSDRGYSIDSTSRVNGLTNLATLGGVWAQTTAGNQPLWVPGDQPLIRFVRSRSDILVGPVLATGVNPYTVALVYKPSILSGGSLILSPFNNGNGSNGHAIVAMSTDVMTEAHLGVNSRPIETITLNNEVRCYINRCPSPNLYLRVRGVDTSPGLTLQLAATGTSAIGGLSAGAWNMSMDFYSLIVFDRSLSTADLNTLSSLITQRYGIAA
jgi:hypothetical protein